MRINSIVFPIVVVVIASACHPHHARAESPLGRLLAKRVEADPSKTYQLSEKNGPWMIMATSFEGLGAEQQAGELVLELRKQYNLPAYTHRKVFDFSKPDFARNRHGNPIKVRYQVGGNKDKRVKHVAVLVGNYDSIDDRQAQETLEKIKHLWPNALEVKGSGDTSRPFDEWQSFQKKVTRERYERGKARGKNRRGPMGMAFLTTNPLLPKSHFVPKGVDKLVADMNKEVKHSLLDCPGKFTLKVATFRGSTIVDPRLIKKLEGSNNPKSRLVKAAEDAHKLTEALRAKGYEAFEFHDRYESSVNVGSFDSQRDPRISLLKRVFAAKRKPGGSHTPDTVVPQVLLGIPFDIQPVLIDVPQRSFGRDYAKSWLSR